MDKEIGYLKLLSDRSTYGVAVNKMTTLLLLFSKTGFKPIFIKKSPDRIRSSAIVLSSLFKFIS
ncbi:hypothetical protein D3C87_1761300 [compost metagenome]